MEKSKEKLRAIDLYSGIGGWSLGLEMAGIEVVASYEWWDKANRTNQKNNRHVATEIDIRKLPLSDLPKQIDVVVGSPPCTQFSLANRGGSGDIEDGLKDIAKFLEVVDYVKPKYWALENVPRVAGILEAELKPGGRLAKFAHLKPEIRIFDICEWGIPQRRQRCIAGNVNFELLDRYRSFVKKCTLGHVVNALSSAKVVDPNYEIELSSGQLYDHVIEEFLSSEEERMNREMKTFHPVYNNMAFPDPLERTARTITAICTRVSRESIVIAAPEMTGRFRRLTVRERGCLQGFPITYQFFGDSYAQKLKMIGNAVPPLFTFYIAQAILGIAPEELKRPREGIAVFNPPETLPSRTPPDTAGGNYPSTRRFRAAIPHLRFKSGVRFELANEFKDDLPRWVIRFYFGNSKSIQELTLDSNILTALKEKQFIRDVVMKASGSMAHVQSAINSTSAFALQRVWNHSHAHGMHPHDIVDMIGQAAGEIIELLSENAIEAQSFLHDFLEKKGSPDGTKKVLSHATSVLAGLLIGSACNSLLLGKQFN